MCPCELHEEDCAKQEAQQELLKLRHFKGTENQPITAEEDARAMKSMQQKIMEFRRVGRPSSYKRRREAEGAQFDALLEVDVERHTRQIRRKGASGKPSSGSRRCSDCPAAIGKDEPTWKVRCMACWRKRKAGA